MPSPLRASPLAGYVFAVAWSTLQVTPPTPEGPAVGVASTVTAWLTQTPGFGSFGVWKETATGSLSTDTVFEADPPTPAALTAVTAIWKLPSVGTCECVSTGKDQLTGLG